MIENIATYQKLWKFRPDGEVFSTGTGTLMPVISREGAAAMLKIATLEDTDENTETALRYFDGLGAVSLLEAQGDAVLMERAIDNGALKKMALRGDDTQATEIIAETITKLHQPRGALPSDLPKLADVMEPLFANASAAPILGYCAKAAQKVLRDAKTETVLHRDIHHENILDSERGWLAIDPKGVIGPPVYEYANSFLNPVPNGDLVHDRARMKRMAQIFSKHSSHATKDILCAALAHAGLATVWFGDLSNAEYGLKCAELLLAELGAADAQD